MISELPQDVRYKCPKCGSQMVVQLDLRDKPSSRQTTPIGSYSSVSSLQNMVNSGATKLSTNQASPTKGMTQVNTGVFTPVKEREADTDTKR